jgi:hypothetical protein
MYEGCFNDLETSPVDLREGRTILEDREERRTFRTMRKDVTEL